MPPPIEVCVEAGARRAFACAVDWPGWCRSGRTEDAALKAVVDYAPRYAAAIESAGLSFAVPADSSALVVVERRPGDATTDFGAPAVMFERDEQGLDIAGAERRMAELQACWEKFDHAVETAFGVELRKGPRGGGRELDAIVAHVIDSEGAYLARIGGRPPKPASPDLRTEIVAVRDAVVDALAARVRGEPLPQMRRSGRVWTPRYAFRRIAWHVLDHAWEIEDRAVP